VPIFDVSSDYHRDLAIASNGDAYALVWYEDDDLYQFAIYRSLDGGTTWERWAHFVDYESGYRYWFPVIHIAEGNEDRCFVAYCLGPNVGCPLALRVAWSPLDLPEGDFSAETTICTHSGGIYSPSLTTDAGSFNSYYVYLAFQMNSSGSDIYFCRSTTQGTSFEGFYMIGRIDPEDRGYTSPIVSYGYGGYVHVLWYLAFEEGHEYDAALRYRRAPDYADGGLEHWEQIQHLSTHDNGVDEMRCSLGTSIVSPDVMVAYLRRVGNTWSGLGTISSDDYGDSFSSETLLASSHALVGNILHQDTTDRWLMACDVFGDWGYYWAPIASPANWSDLVVMSDEYYTSSYPAIALDPSRSYRVGIHGSDHEGDATTCFFDAEWRDDPGYPNYEEGFPIDLGYTPDSDPGLVDLDGDGDQEIIFTDDVGRIHVIRHDGTPLPGWPVDLGAAASSSPVAVGDLTGGGLLTVVAGTIAGTVHAFNADGSIADGWPWDSGEAAPAYITLGALGGPYLRAVVVAVGNTVQFLDYQGGAYPNAYVHLLPASPITTEPAVGDVDGDGVSEVVVSVSNFVFAFKMLVAGVEITAILEDEVSSGVALGDFDLDGDVEVVVPLANGTVHLLDDDGTEFPGDWPVAAVSSEITGLAIATCLGSLEPEIVVTGRDWTVSLLWEDGEVGIGWPVQTDGWYLWGDPIIAAVEGASPDIVIGARGWKSWSWNNFGDINPGWPKQMGEHIRLAPAYGDIDLDGSAEIVFLSESQLHVVDIGTAPGADVYTWAMAGHDHERTSCSDCPVDYYAAVDAEPTVTRINFAAPSPNPTTRETVFSYAIPVRAAVELTILDVTGRRVATVNRAEQGAGHHVIAWDGCDRAGLPVASGHYMAMLKVRGPGVNQTIARKVTVLR
jgi:hypothetical protein